MHKSIRIPFVMKEISTEKQFIQCSIKIEQFAKRIKQKVFNEHSQLKYDPTKHCEDSRSE